MVKTISLKKIEDVERRFIPHHRELSAELIEQRRRRVDSLARRQAGIRAFANALGQAIDVDATKMRFRLPTGVFGIIKIGGDTAKIEIPVNSLPEVAAMLTN